MFHDELKSCLTAPEKVADHLAEATAPEKAMLKGFGDETFEVWRVKAH